MTIGEAAELLARVDTRHSAGYLARQLRTFVQHGALTPVDYRGEGRTAAALFDEVGICAARLLCVAATLGLTAGQLVVVSRLFKNMDNEARQHVPAGVPYLPGLPVAIKGVLAAETWFFVVHVASWADDPDAGDSEGLMGGFTMEPKFTIPCSMEAVSLVFNCEALFGQLLNDLHRS